MTYTKTMFRVFKLRFAVLRFGRHNHRFADHRFAGYNRLRGVRPLRGVLASASSMFDYGGQSAMKYIIDHQPQPDLRAYLKVRNASAKTNRHWFMACLRAYVLSYGTPIGHGVVEFYMVPELRIWTKVHERMLHINGKAYFVNKEARP